MMTKEEIIEMARQAGLFIAHDSEGQFSAVHDGEILDMYPDGDKERDRLYREKRFVEILGPFAKLVAEKAIKKALAQPAQPKYRRGDRLICLETEEYCVIHISGTDRQWVKFPTSYIGVYTNEQVAELFELLPKEPKQELVVGCAECGANGNFALYCVTCAEKFVGGILKDNTSRQ